MKILLADDDRLVLATLGQGLRRAGYEILEAASGAEAIALGKSEEPDLAILDVRMPDLDGVQVGARLAGETQVPFLFLSAHDDTELVKEAIERGALGYLIKPIDVPQLIPSIEAALTRASELRDLRESEERLRGALVRQRSTAIAVGILMERYHVDADEAFERLRRRARGDRRKVNEIADQLVESVEILNRFGGPESGHG